MLESGCGSFSEDTVEGGVGFDSAVYRFGGRGLARIRDGIGAPSVRTGTLKRGGSEGDSGEYADREVLLDEE